MAGRGRPGREPQAEKKELYARLIARGFGNSEACRIAGINRRTGKRWRCGMPAYHGRKLPGQVGAVPDTAVHAESPVRREAVSGIPDEERAAAPPGVSDGLLVVPAEDAQNVHVERLFAGRLTDEVGAVAISEVLIWLGRVALEIVNPTVLVANLDSRSDN
jgi:hypothetical protein